MNDTNGSEGLVLTKLTKNFGSFYAVKNVDLNISNGEFLTLLGPSGSGKTTLLMMLAGFQEITSGDISLGGHSIVNLSAEKRNFGMVFQGYALFHHMTVRENIGYSLSVRKRSKAEIDTRVDQMLDLVQLQGFGNRFPRELSGGQQQRVALARALIFAPPILLLDEPLGALDKKLRIEVQSQLKEIHKVVGTTFIYVTHDQDEAMSMSDRVVIMREGQIEQIGSPEELYQFPKTKFSAGFLGKSNFINKDNKSFAIRPEKIDLFPAGTGKGDTIISGNVKRKTYFGSLLNYEVQTSDYGVLEVDVDAWRSGAQLQEGAEVDLCWLNTAPIQLTD